MDKLILNSGQYIFDASAKTVQVSKYKEFFTPEYLLLITNITTNDIIYNFGCDGYGGTFNTNTSTVTLEYDTTSMSDTDRLQVVMHTKESTLEVVTLLEIIREQTQIMKETNDSLKHISKYIKKIYEP